MSDHGLDGLANVNVELTSRCNKNCWICGRRKVERDHPELVSKYDDMDFGLVERIADQLPPRIVVQLHNNGEALLYPRFGDAVRLFRSHVTNVVTNGKLILEKADEIIDNLDTMAISVFEKDPEADEQLKTIEEFVALKGSRKPYTVLRVNGEVDVEPYMELGLLLVNRALHSPMGSFNYRKVDPTIPEIGICLDFLHHLSINSEGKASICVRFDPKGLGIIGDVREQSLEEIWNCEERMEWLEYHKRGKRDMVPLCSRCDFWGVPTTAPSADGCRG